MFLSDLAKDMAENLCIDDDLDDLDIQGFIYALEDGEVLEQLEKLGYCQEDFERVHEELSNFNSKDDFVKDHFKKKEIHR